ncbi:MAG: F-type H+-transporting ATPase subunit a [Verrucomicrobiales bacterium]|jgi:F-type H+-transporting ATPase subunit a
MQNLGFSLESAPLSSLLAAVTPYAQNLPFSEWITNSIFVAVLVLVLVLAFSLRATAKMRLIPSGIQNFVEFVVEFLYGQVEGIVGKKVAPRAFPLLATMFLFILVANWSGLIPGVGTAGWMVDKEGHVLPTSAPLTLDHGGSHGEEGDHGDHGGAHGEDAPHLTALLRPAAADLNMTLGIAFCSFLLWIHLTIREGGVHWLHSRPHLEKKPWLIRELLIIAGGWIVFLKHTFEPKGVKGGLWWGLLLIFILVGVIELVSIVFRPISLSFRLYGNLYAGETLLHTMGTLGETMGLGKVGSFISSVLLPIPFYFMEILVGFLQAMVFSLLSAVYISLSTSHEEH